MTSDSWPTSANRRRERWALPHRPSTQRLPGVEGSRTPSGLARLGANHKAGADATNANDNPPNGIELRRNTRKPNRGRAQRAEVKAAGAVSSSDLFAGRYKGPPLHGTNY